MNFWWRLPKRVAYLEQRGEDLELVIDALARQLANNGLELELPIPSMRAMLTDVSAGGFCMALQMRYPTNYKSVFDNDRDCAYCGDNLICESCDDAPYEGTCRYCHVDLECPKCDS